MTRTFSDRHPKVLPACNFLSQYYFITFSYRSLAGFLFKLLRSSMRLKPEVALDFCVWPLCAHSKPGLPMLTNHLTYHFLHWSLKSFQYWKVIWRFVCLKYEQAKKVSHIFRIIIMRSRSAWVALYSRKHFPITSTHCLACQLKRISCNILQLLSS